MDLSQLKPSQCGEVLQMDTHSNSSRRLLDVGVHVGAHIKVTRIAPLGDPIEIRINDFSLALRKSDAKKIIVSLIEDGGNK